MSDSPSTTEANGAGTAGLDSDSAAASPRRAPTSTQGDQDGARIPDLHTGFSAFAAGFLLGALALVFGVYSGMQTTGSAGYWQFRELAFAAALLAFPAFALSDVALVPVERRVRRVLVIGFSLCVLATGLFVQTYPSQWIGGNLGNAILTFVVYAVGLIGLATPRVSSLATRVLERPLLGTEDDSGATPDVSEPDREPILSDLAEDESRVTTSRPESDEQTPPTDQDAADSAPESTGRIAPDDTRTDRTRKVHSNDSSLDSAHEQLQSGNPDRAVTITYNTVQRHIVDTLQFQPDSVETPHELLEMCQQEDIDDEACTSVRTLIEVFERVVFGADQISTDESRTAVASGEAVLERM